MELLEGDRLLNALARVFHEDARKSLDLCINLLTCFFTLSNFSNFHPAIRDYSLGAGVWDIIALELHRTEKRREKLGLQPSIVA